MRARALLGAVALAALLAPLALPAAPAGAAQPYQDFQVTPWLEDVTDVDWSPDGAALVMTKKVDVAGKSYEHIFRAAANGSGPVDLMPDWASNNGTAVWSADGAKIAWVSDATHAFDIGGAGGGPGVDLWIMDADGTHKHQLTFAGTGGTSFRPRWSHSGRRLFWTQAWWRVDGTIFRWELKVADLVGDADGSHLEAARVINPRVDDTAFYESADFTRDDTGVYYTGTTDNSGNYELYRYDFADAAVTRLTRDPELDESAHVSPDGSRLAFISSRDNHSTWSTYEDVSWDADMPPVADDHAVIIANTAIAWLQPINPQGTDIYLMKPDGSGVMRLTQLSDEQVGGGVPAWHPDGCHLATTAFITPNVNEHPRITDVTKKRSITQLITFSPCAPL